MAEVTLCGLSKWFNKELEKLPWLIIMLQDTDLSKEFQKNKICMYIDSLKELEKALHRALKEIILPDNQRDLKIKINKLQKFQKTVLPILNSICKVQEGGAKKK
jgi:hypothetical protein